MLRRSPARRAISGRSDSIGPPESVENRLKNQKTAKRKRTLPSVSPGLGGIQRSTKRTAMNGVAAITKGMRRPQRERVRSLQ